MLVYHRQKLSGILFTATWWTAKEIKFDNVFNSQKWFNVQKKFVGLRLHNM
jgi:hypothetical protein